MGILHNILHATALILITLLLEGVILSSIQYLSASAENQWFRQWPFSVNNNNEPTGGFDFASNETHVELVLGIQDKREPDCQKLIQDIAEQNGRVVSSIVVDGKIQSLVASVPTDKVSLIIKNVLSDESVRYIEPNWKRKADVAPNDAGWIYQWGLSRIQAADAWNLQKGNHGVLVAVVDTGIYYTHADLASNYVSRGYDWVNGDADPMDDNGHGTHCAGIIAAVLNNSIGIAGLAQVGVMAEKALDHNGAGYDDDLANAIIHAADQEAKIISCSWGSGQESQLIHDAISYAIGKGALIVAAAGNSGTNTRHYPAAYPEVIAVTATDETDSLADFSSYGDWVDLAAPGTSIYSTYLWNMYFSLSGTSMACPHVAGVAALIWSQYPSMTNEQVRSQLLNTADDLGSPRFDIYYGYGRVNAKKAVAQTVALIGSKVVDAPANTVYFLHLNPSESTTPESGYDSIASGVVYGLTVNTQKQSFKSSGQLVLETGALNASSVANATVVVFGGPCPQKTVEYYEMAGLTPAKFFSNQTYYKFVTQNGQTIAELSKSKAESGHEDMFLIEVLMDRTNTIVIMYGFTWKGTWAAGIYFKEMVAGNLNSYSERCYVFHWIDNTLQNGIPESIEIHQETLVP